MQNAIHCNQYQTTGYFLAVTKLLETMNLNVVMSKSLAFTPTYYFLTNYNLTLSLM